MLSRFFFYLRELLQIEIVRTVLLSYCEHINKLADWQYRLPKMRNAKDFGEAIAL